MHGRDHQTPQRFVAAVPVLNIPALVNNALRRLQAVHLPRVRPRIVRCIPHDETAFTQGLCFAEGYLYESTGTYGASSLGRLDPGTGAVLERVAVNGEFAEDVAYVAGYLCQLTWQSGRVLKYALNPLRLVGEEKIHHEGWGVACRRGELLVTDGTSTLRRYQPGMREVASCTVRCAGLPFRHLNAMEVVDSFAYVNVWYSALIAKVDLETMRLAAIIDCAELERLAAPRNPHHILNGIAQNPSTGTFYVTGKHWRSMFEIVIS